MWTRAARWTRSFTSFAPDANGKPFLCLDKGFDYPEAQELVRDYDTVPHIRSRGEEKKDIERIPGYRARRWVVERTHSWMNRFRRLLIRWEKKKVNFLNMIYLACAVITFRAAGFSDSPLSASHRQFVVDPGVEPFLDMIDRINRTAPNDPVNPVHPVQKNQVRGCAGGATSSGRQSRTRRRRLGTALISIA